MKKLSTIEIKKVKTVFFAFFAVFISSCGSSIHIFTIETLEPASVTLPSDINSVFIVNNTVRQPGNIAGISRTYSGKTIEDYELNLDSVSWNSIQMLNVQLKNDNFFDKVSVYAKPARNDGEWMSIIPLQKEFKHEVFDIHGFDAIISIDRILFSVEEDVRNLHELLNVYPYVHVKNIIKGNLDCSIYLYDKEEPFAAFTLSDSLIYDASVYADSIIVLKELPEAQINELAYSLIEQLLCRIVPFWVYQERALYVVNNSRMKEAFIFAKKGKWNMAESVWINEYERQSSNSTKSKIANNIAIANEMRDNLDAALLWAIKAKEHAPNDSDEKAYIDAYISSLQKRIENSRLLDLQGGNK